MSAHRVRVLVVGLGTMGTSHARAYKAIEDFELVGLCTRTRRRAPISRPSSPACRASRRSTRVSLATRPDAVAVCAYTEHHAAMALKALAAGAHVFCEKPLADTLEAAERIVAAAREARQDAADRLHPARASVVDALRRDRPDARQAAGHAHEPQPAVGGLVLAGAQESHAVDLADRRLRRPLRRHHVPGDGRAARRRARDRRPAHRRDRAGDVQLRPPRHHVRRRVGRLVRGRAGGR